MALYLNWNAVGGQNLREPGKIVENIFQIQRHNGMKGGQVKVGVDSLSVLFSVADAKRFLQTVVDDTILRQPRRCVFLITGCVVQLLKTQLKNRDLMELNSMEWRMLKRPVLISLVHHDSVQL